MTAQSAAPRRTIMTTFTINETNEIVAFSNQEEAAATATPFDSFASQKELAELAKAWPAERLVAIFNSLTGVTPVESFKSAQAAASSRRRPNARGPTVAQQWPFLNSSRNSADQSARARHRPCKSGWTARICASMAAISRRHWVIHAASWRRSSAI
jgi:hypothetical protein